jgi:TRAP-type C4-dicarboxylate transport system substrate-binding protein
MRKFGLVVLAILSFNMLLTTADARQLRYATGHPPNSDGHLGAETYAKFVKEHSNGELSVRVFPMSLLSYAETSDGLRDGIADVGMVLGPYYPSHYPRLNMLSDASMLLAFNEKAQDMEGLIYSGALAEFMFFHCPDCHQEFANQNQVFTGVSGSSRYGLVCTRPINSLSDLQGRRIRVAGPSWARWAEYMGAAPTSMPGNEMYEALSQGVITCASTSAPELVNLRLMETASDVIMEVPGGIFAGAATTQINKNVWKKLTTQQKTLLIRGGAVYSADLSIRYQKSAVKALQASEESGVRISKAPQDVREKTIAFIDADMKTIVDHYSSRYGISDANEMIARFRPLLEKWTDLVQDVSNAEDLAEIYWQEVYSKVDPETLGK